TRSSGTHVGPIAASDPPSGDDPRAADPHRGWPNGRAGEHSRPGAKPGPGGRGLGSDRRELRQGAAGSVGGARLYWSAGTPVGGQDRYPSVLATAGPWRRLAVRVGP